MVNNIFKSAILIAIVYVYHINPFPTRFREKYPLAIIFCPAI